MKAKKLSLFEMTLFAMFGAMMFISKIVMEFLPNIHLLGMFTILLTIVYRQKALIPIYIYVFLNGVFAGFNMWWIPYLYIWTVLWALTMLIPQKTPVYLQVIIYPLLCALHGLCFGLLYAPFQCYAMYGGDWSLTLTWLIKGALFDTFHMVGNLTSALLVIPLVRLLFKLSGRKYPFSPLTSLRNKK